MSITGYIILFTCLISVLAFQNSELLDRLMFKPHVIHERRQWYRFISSGMIHADWVHLFVNMYVFYLFGRMVEDYFKELFEERATINYLLLYFGGMATSIIPTFNKQKHNASYNALGASGAVSAIVFAYILFHPLQKLCLFFIACIPGIIFGGLYLVYCYYAGKRGGDYINHDAHLWGALFGFFFTVLLYPGLFTRFLSQLPFLNNAF